MKIQYICKSMKPTPETLNLIARRTKILSAMQQATDPERYERLSNILFRITALIIGKEKVGTLEALKQRHRTLKTYEQLRYNANAIQRVSIEICFFEWLHSVLSKSQYAKGGIVNTQTSDDWSEYVIGKSTHPVPPPPQIPPKEPINTL